MLKGYITNISALQYYQLFRFGALLVIAIVFAKVGLSVAAIGEYETLLLIAGAITFFWVSGLIQSLLPICTNNATYGDQENNSTSKSPELFNAFILLFTLSALATLFVWAFKGSISEQLTGRPELPYFKLILVYIFLSSPANLVEYVYVIKNKPNQILIYGTITFLIQIVIVAGPPFLGYEIAWSIYGMIIISAIRVMWLVWLMIRYAKWVVSFSFIKEHLRLGIPLILSLFLSGSAQYIDGAIVTYKFDQAAFAIFRYGARELPVVLLMASAFSSALLPEFSKKEDIPRALGILKAKSGRLMHLLFPLTIVMLLTSHWLYPLIFNKNFAESASVFNIYLLLIVSRLVFPQTILIGLRKTNIIFIGSGIELVINVALSLWLITVFGIIGVAYATVIAFFIEKIGFILYVKRKLNITADQYIPIGKHIIYSLITIIVYVIVEFYPILFNRL